MEINEPERLLLIQVSVKFQISGHKTDVENRPEKSRPQLLKMIQQTCAPSYGLLFSR